MRIVVTGWVAPFPTAGFLWHPLSYVLGFRALGHECWYLEDAGDHPWGWDTERGREDPTCTAGITFLERELAALGLGDRWVFRDVPGCRHHGMSAEETADVLAGADVLVNVSLTTPMRPEYLRIPHRLAIDTDPVFTQIRIARGDAALGAIPETHTRLYTFGRPPLPGQRHEWVPTRQPVATEAWPVAPPPPEGAPFTSVTTWKAYPAQVWEGVEYGAKDRSFRELLELPRLSGSPLEVALGAGSDPREGVALLAAHGWQVSDPLEATRTSAHYRHFLARSRGEIGIAKHGYVQARSGWFSERTCCYLASGRPAVVYDTGWTDWLPAGEGLLAFRTPAEAAGWLWAVDADWDRHSRAARRLVEEHFRAADVCRELLDAA